MIAIDTNILVRYLTNDDAQQAAQVNDLFAQYITKEHSIFINNIVLCELVWVLNRGYKYSKTEITKTLKLLMTAIEFAFEDRKLVFQAILEYEKSTADFSDALIGIINNNTGFNPTYSLDQKACVLTNFKAL